MKGALSLLEANFYYSDWDSLSPVMLPIIRQLEQDLDFFSVTYCPLGPPGSTNPYGKEVLHSPSLRVDVGDSYEYLAGYYPADRLAAILKTLRK